MPDFLTEAYFIWFIIGFILALLELAAPGFILVFFGLGAWCTAALSAAFNISLAWQVALFMAFSVLAILLLRRIWMRAFKGTAGEDGTDEGLTEPKDVGRTVEVLSDMAPGVPGEIKYRGSFWRAVTETGIKAGQPALITGKPDNGNADFTIAPLKQGD